MDLPTVADGARWREGGTVSLRSGPRANRGAALEEALEYRHNAYRVAGVADIRKLPTDWHVTARRGAGAERERAAFPARKSAVDYLGFLKDGSGRHVAVEAKQTTVNWRTIRHHVAVRDAHPGRTVRTVVFWGRRRSPKHMLRSGDPFLAVEEVPLARRRAAPVLECLESRAGRGEALSAADGFLLALVPLMEGARPLPGVVARGMAMAHALPEELREPVLESMQALAYSRGDAAERAGIREVLKSMPLPQELYEDLRKEFLAEGRTEGRAEGRTEEARAGLIKVFTLRLGPVPEAVRRVVEGELDLEKLEHWLEVVARAGDAAEAGRAILGSR